MTDLLMTKLAQSWSPSGSHEDDIYNTIWSIGETDILAGETFNYRNCVTTIKHCIYLVSNKLKIFRLCTQTLGWAEIGHQTAYQMASEVHRYVFSYSNYLYIWPNKDGNDLNQASYRFNTATDYWEEFLVSGPLPIFSPTNTCCVVGDFMIYYGNEDSQVHVFNLSTNCWDIFATNGRGPGQRFMHTATAYLHFMCVYGGNIPNGAVDSVIYLLDTVDFSWISVHSHNYNPQPPIGSQVVGVYGSNLHVFGRFSYGNERSPNKTAVNVMMFRFPRYNWTVMTRPLRDQPLHLGYNVGSVVVDNMWFMFGDEEYDELSRGILNLNMTQSHQRASNIQETRTFQTSTKFYMYSFKLIDYENCLSSNWNQFHINIPEPQH